jgi:hypothetical protein
MRTSVIAMGCCLSFAAGAQPAPASAQGRVELLEPWTVTHLLARHAEFIEEIETIEGYRVQVIATTELDHANAIKAQVVSHFRDHKAYLDFFSPYYKVRVGDFTTKLEAYACLMEIRRVFPDAYIVMDMVEIKEL